MKRLMRTGNQEDRRYVRLQSVRDLPALLLWLRQGLKQDSGRSLPAALITLAVGSLLLTPFLSFISSRSLGTRAAEGAFREQYAADAGIEFGIWSLLNDSAFRSQVDINAGTAQPLPFPDPINGFTPSITVTGIPFGNWIVRQNHPSTISQGGSLVYTGGDRVYALAGSSSDFGYYSILADQWFDLANTDENVGRGGSLVYDGGDYIYALRGGNKKDFWRFNINIVNANWEIRADTLENVGAGGSLAFAGGNIYALRGGNKDDFWLYDISGDEWSDLAVTPSGVGAGGALVTVGGNTLYAVKGGNKTDFWRYTIDPGNPGSWSSRQNTPGNVGNGGALAYYSGDYIYSLQGKFNGFWRYTVTMNSWSLLADTPNTQGIGGSLVFTHANGGYAFRGNSIDFWEFEVTPPRYEISSQAGSVDTDARFEIDGSTKTILFWDIE